MRTRTTLGLGLLLLATSCATVRTDREPATGTPYLVARYGKVVRANTDLGFVVLECAVLPKPGERITLFREKTETGKVRTTQIMSGRHVAADVEEGAPGVGDWFTEERSPVTGSEITP